MRKECWCPICGMKTESTKIRWVWFWVTLLFITPVFPIYLLYCLLTSQRVCTRCHNRVKFYLNEDEFRSDKNDR